MRSCPDDPGDLLGALALAVDDLGHARTQAAGHIDLGVADVGHGIEPHALGELVGGQLARRHRARERFQI